MTDIPGILLLSIRTIIVVLLYIFLALCIRVLWLNLKARDDEQERYSPIPPLHFSITDPNNPSTKYILEAPEASLGRAPENTFQIREDTVSSRHARLFFESGQWWIQDSGSSNGTHLNNSPITQASILTPDDHIQIGKTTLEITRTTARPPSQPEIGESDV